MMPALPDLPWMTADGPVASGAAPLAQRVHDDVLARILRGDLRPGQRINEPDVAERLGVSRVPVREALRQLESTGLVVARKHAGVFVHAPAPADVSDDYELRAVLDAHAGRRVAAAPTPALLAMLDATIDDMAAAAAALDVPTYYAQNLRFHWAVVEAAGNAAIARAYRDVVQRLHVARLGNLRRLDGIETSIAEHRRIVGAIRDRDPERCAALMQAHVSRAYDRLATSEHDRSTMHRHGAATASASDTRRPRKRRHHDEPT